MGRSAASEMTKSGGHLHASGRSIFINPHAFKRRAWPLCLPVNRYAKTAPGTQGSAGTLLTRLGSFNSV
jgi:hypothetical protein